MLRWLGFRRRLRMLPLHRHARLGWRTCWTGRTARHHQCQRQSRCGNCLPEVAHSTHPVLRHRATTGRELDIRPVLQCIENPRTTPSADMPPARTTREPAPVARCSADRARVRQSCGASPNSVSRRPGGPRRLVLNSTCNSGRVRARWLLGCVGSACVVNRSNSVARETFVLRVSRAEVTNSSVTTSSG